MLTKVSIELILLYVKRTCQCQEIIRREETNLVIVLYVLHTKELRFDSPKGLVLLIFMVLYWYLSSRTHFVLKNCLRSELSENLIKSFHKKKMEIRLIDSHNTNYCLLPVANNIPY